MAKTAACRNYKGKWHSLCENVWYIMKRMGGIVTSWRKRVECWWKKSQKWNETYVHYRLTGIKICIYVYLCMQIDFYTYFYTLIYETSIHCHNIKAKGLISISVVICWHFGWHCSSNITEKMYTFFNLKRFRVSQSEKSADRSSRLQFEWYVIIVMLIFGIDQVMWYFLYERKM